MHSSLEHRPAAILWDMDGTLIDTEPYWMEAEYELLEGHGLSWSKEQGLMLVGNELKVSAQIIKDETGLTMPVEAIVEALLDGVIRRMRQHVPWRPGARELLTQAREADVPCALVTMSYTSFANVLIEVLPPNTFEVVVTGDVVSRGKPHPEPYERAAYELGLKPEQCIAFEDSATGVRSAVSAGVPTVAIPHLVQVPELPGLTRVESLETVRLGDLASLAAQARAIIAPNV